MSQVFSEINKIVSVLAPGVQSSGASNGTAVFETDIVNMKLYKHCTFVMSLGATVASTVYRVLVMACPAATGTGLWTPITFNYRTQNSTGTSTTGESGSDTPSALTAGTSTGVPTTTGYVGGVIIFEVDAPTVCAAGSSGGGDFDHVKLYWASTADTYAPRACSVIAILSEPRYPQAVLDSAID